MQAIILAAGYATRLYPLTKDQPKALLPVGGRAILDRLVAQMVSIPVLDTIHIATNAKFAPIFTSWAERAGVLYPGVRFHVWDDGTSSNETRLGALGDIQFVIDRAALRDDVFITASDTFFTFDLTDFYADFARHGKDVVLAHVEKSREDCKRFAVVVTDGEGRVTSLGEKPEHPKSNVAAYAAYIYRADTLPLLRAYLAQGGNPDAPGHFPAWLCDRKELRAWLCDGECVDIGTLKTYRMVCEAYKD